MSRFSGFVILAGMRTGSNLLEQMLRQVPGIVSHGELFNPGFIGKDKVTRFRGVTLEQRESDPLAVIGAMRAAEPGALHGFRLFQDHDPRVLAHVLQDQATAKVILTRDPLDSYLSWRASLADGRWRIGNPLKRKSHDIRFDPAAFRRWEAMDADFRARVDTALQHSGQAAFRLSFNDLTDGSVLRGLVAWLGLPAARHDPRPVTARQNRDDLRAVVTNPEALPPAGHRAQRAPGLPNLPDRIPAAGGVIFAPLPEGPDPAVLAWLTGLRPAGPPGQPVTFALVRHPLLRAWSAFRSLVLVKEEGPASAFHLYLAWRYQISLPERRSAAHLARAFESFLVFLGDNLALETSQPVHALWARQGDILAAMARTGPVHLAARLDAWPAAAGWIAATSGNTAPAAMPLADADAASLGPVIRPAMNAAARRAYAGDYAAFGWPDLDQAACEASVAVRMA